MLERELRIILMLRWVIGECMTMGYADGAYVYARICARYCMDQLSEWPSDES